LIGKYSDRAFCILGLSQNGDKLETRRTMVQKNITLTALKQHLKSVSKEDLVDDIAELYKKIAGVKDFYQLKLSSPEETQVISKYKQTIENQFFPKRGYGKAKLSVAKKAISDYKKVSVSPLGMIDLMLFYVEQGVKFTNSYGDINEGFYNSMEGMYEKTIELILKYEQESIFEDRCEKIVDDASGIGWGFSDALLDMYNAAFCEEEEEE